MSFKDFLDEIAIYEKTDSRHLEDVIKGYLKTLYIHCIKIFRYNRQEDFIKHISNMNKFEEKIKTNFKKLKQITKRADLYLIATKVREQFSFEEWIENDLEDYENNKLSSNLLTIIPFNKQEIEVNKLYDSIVKSLNDKNIFNDENIQKIAKYYNLTYDKQNKQFNKSNKLKSKGNKNERP